MVLFPMFLWSFLNFGGMWSLLDHVSICGQLRDSVMPALRNEVEWGWQEKGRIVGKYEHWRDWEGMMGARRREGFVVGDLRPGNMWGHIRVGTDLGQCAFTATIKCFSTGKMVCQHDDPISHSVTLSWHLANQSLPYANNAWHQTRSSKYHFDKSSYWLGWESNSKPSAQESSALLIARY